MDGHVHNGIRDSLGVILKQGGCVWVGHGLFEIKGMATKRFYEHKDNQCEVC
jgi:hypothetical protein